MRLIDVGAHRGLAHQTRIKLESLLRREPVSEQSGGIGMRRSIDNNQVACVYRYVAGKSASELTISREKPSPWSR